MPNPQNPYDERVQQFRDTEGLTTRQLNVGLWYIKNRKTFFIILVIVLGLTAFATVGYSLYQFSSYIFVGVDQDRQTYLDLTSSTSLITNKINVGNNVSYSDARLLPGKDNTYDLVAAITNSNPMVLVKLRYAFDVGGQTVGETEDFVLPGDTKYFMALNQDVPNASTSLIIQNTSFIRLDRHKISDWDKYRSERLNFVITDAHFKTSTESGLSEKINLGQLDFKITNNTAFGYKTVPLAILLKSQGNIVAVNRYIINNFKSGEQKTVQMSWPGRLPNVTQVEILPDINITDDSVFLKYSL